MEFLVKISNLFVSSWKMMQGNQIRPELILISLISGMIGGIFTFILMRLLCRRGRRHSKCDYRSSENNQISKEVIVKKEKCCAKKEEKLVEQKTAPLVEKNLVTEKVILENKAQNVQPNQNKRQTKASSTDNKPTEVKKVNEKQTAPASNSTIKTEDDGEWVVAKKGRNKAY